MAKRTSSPADRKLMADLNISGEVLAYMQDAKIPLPDCPPRIKTPEPSRVRGAMFDAGRVDRVLKAFGLLRHTQGQWAGRPLKPDPWQIAYILAPVFGWVKWDKDSDLLRPDHPLVLRGRSSQEWQVDAVRRPRAVHAGR